MKGELLLKRQKEKIAAGDIGYQTWPPRWEPPHEIEMPEVQDLANKIVQDYNNRKGTHMILFQLVKALREASCGALYDFTLILADQAHLKNRFSIQKMVWTGCFRELCVPKHSLLPRELIADDEIIVHKDDQTIQDLADRSLGRLRGQDGIPLTLDKVISHEVRETKKGYGKGPEFRKFTTYRLHIQTKSRPSFFMDERRRKNEVAHGSQVSVIVLERAWLKFLDTKVENSFRSRVEHHFPAHLLPRPTYEPPMPTITACTGRPNKTLTSRTSGSPVRELSIADMCTPYVITAAWIALEDHNFRNKVQLRFVQVVKVSYRNCSGSAFYLTIVAEDQGQYKLFKTDTRMVAWNNYFACTPLKEVGAKSKKRKILDSVYIPPAGTRSSERLKLLRLKKSEENGK